MRQLADAVDALMQREDEAGVLRAVLARDDFNSAVSSTAGARHWFWAHANAGVPKIRGQLERVYQEADRLLVPLYEELGRREGRAPTTSWFDVALALTTWVEGQALRYLSSPEMRASIRWVGTTDDPGVIERGADGLWMAFTTARER